MERNIFMNESVKFTLSEWEIEVDGSLFIGRGRQVVFANHAFGQILQLRFRAQVNHMADCDFVSFKCNRHTTSKSALS